MDASSEPVADSFIPTTGASAAPLVAVDFVCPTCAAPAGTPCVTRDGKATKPHAQRGGPDAA